MISRVEELKGFEVKHIGPVKTCGRYKCCANDIRDEYDNHEFCNPITMPFVYNVHRS